MMEEYIQSLDPHLKYMFHEDVNGVLVIHAESNQEAPLCPWCGTASTRCHSKYTHQFRDLPMGGKHVEIVIHNRRMKCVNEICDHTTFAERFDCVEPKAKKSRRLEEVILLMSKEMSANAASKALSESLAPVDRWYISEMQKRRAGPNIDKTKVFAAGVDDTAIKRRLRYASVLIDLAGRCCVEIIPSRKKEDVVAMLQEFPNLMLITRDGSSSYRAAITEAFPDAIQVSDFFHLINNLLAMAAAHLKKRIPVAFGLPGDSEDVPGSGASYFDKKPKETKKERQAREKKEAREELHRQIMAMTAAEMKAKDIAEKLGIPVSRVYTYRAPDFSAEDKRTGVARSSMVAPFASRLFALLEAGKTIKEAYEEICALGYTGSYNTVAQFANQERRRAWEAGAKINRMERKRLLAHLYNPDAGHLTDSEMEKVRELYPRYGEVFDLVAEFRALFELEREEPAGEADADTENVRATRPSDLHRWLEKADAIGSSAISSFAKGVRMDLDAVAAAMFFMYTNGLVEGKNNKLKVAKRVMYGRCGFALLRAKFLALEDYNKIPSETREEERRELEELIEAFREWVA